MNIEQRIQESPFSEGDITAAQELLKNDDLLKDDPYAMAVVTGAGFISERNEYVKDLGDFLHARRAYLEGEEGKERLAEFDADLVGVVSSVRPDLERE